MDLENVIYIFAYHFANVGMKPEVPFYNIFMYLYNKNILEYAQIAQSEPKSMIHNIKGRPKNIFFRRSTHVDHKCCKKFSSDTF